MKITNEACLTGWWIGFPIKCNCGITFELEETDRPQRVLVHLLVAGEEQFVDVVHFQCPRCFVAIGLSMSEFQREERRKALRKNNENP